jgi:hypothetical protein
MKMDLREKLLQLRAAAEKLTQEQREALAEKEKALRANDEKEKRRSR